MLRPVLISLLIVLPVSVAAAQERAPSERAFILELSYTLGESHALRQACQGVDDQYWRQRMQRLTDVEQADQAFDVQMRDRFNTGYAAGQAQHPACDPETRRAAGISAARGKALSDNLAAVMLPAAGAQASPTP